MRAAMIWDKPIRKTETAEAMATVLRPAPHQLWVTRVSYRLASTAG